MAGNAATRYVSIQRARMLAQHILTVHSPSGELKWICVILRAIDADGLFDP